MENKPKYEKIRNFMVFYEILWSNKKKSKGRFEPLDYWGVLALFIFYNFFSPIPSKL